MSYEYSKLKGRIKEIFGTQEAFAAAMGMSSAALSARLNNVNNFSQAEIDLACKLLHIPDGEIRSYFFCRLSSENRNYRREA
ncbi:DUF739 family protein [Acidaminococcus sp. LBK-2]|uniref:DUF739 family protein n=1 Tax=Acidaminococcus sp. LBK-2 TaxID=3456956 RepID=UPI003FA47C3E